MFRVDQRRVGRLGGVVPPTGCGLSARVLRRGDDLEILLLQLPVNLLPAWQIESAASPGGPRHDEHFLAAKTGEVYWPAGAIGHDEVGRHASFEEAAAQRLDVAKAPDLRVEVGDDRLSDLLRERAE